MADFSRGYKIKLITTGTESGTWGTSTNENLKRIDQTFAGSVSLDVTVVSSPSVWTPTPAPILSWCLANTADAWAVESTPRNRYVSFTGWSAPITVNIRGADDTATDVDRIYWVTNNLSGDLSTITFNSGSGTTVVLQNGASAFIYAAGGNVENMLGTLQAAGLDFRDADSQINLKTLSTDALKVVDSATTFDYLKFRTSTLEPAIEIGSADVETNVGSTVIDARSPVDGVKLFVRDDEASSFEIYEGDFPTGAAGKSYIKVVTTNGSERVEIEQNLLIGSARIFIPQTSDMELVNNSPTALEMGSLVGGVLYPMLTFDTTTAATRVLFNAPIAGSLAFTSVDGDITKSGTVGAINNFSIGASTASTGKFTTVEAATEVSFGGAPGGTGPSIKLSGTDLTIREDASGAYGQFLTTGMASGNGAYFTDSEALYGAAPPTGSGQWVEFAHGLGSVPRIVLWEWELTTDAYSITEGWDEGDRIAFSTWSDIEDFGTPSNDRILYTTYKNATYVGFVKNVNADSFEVADKYAGSATVGTKIRFQTAAGPGGGVSQVNLVCQAWK